MKNMQFCALAAISFTTACVSAPDISLPPAPPTQWLGDAASTQQTPVDAWWRASIDDPLLIDLIERAGEINTVDEAQARFMEARARVGGARGDLLPNVSASGESTRTDPANAPAYDIDQASIGVGLDLDLFGASRARLRAALAGAGEQEALLRLARIEARRNVADLYVALRSAQAQRAAALAAENSANESLSLSESRNAAGLDSGLSPAQARAARDAARALTPQFSQAEIEARLALEALLGMAPGALEPALADPHPIPIIAAEALLQSPAEVLAAHPSIAAAEARLARAGFNAAAARADLWPRISVEAALLSASAPLGAAVSDGEQSQTAIAITAPLFNFGRLRALARAEGFAAEAEAARFRQAVLDQLAEVETQRAALLNARLRYVAQAQAHASARDAADLARARYRSGLSSFLDVLTAERTLYDADSALAIADAERAQAGAALAAALGLGQS